jgi:hypothetical protein
MTGCRERVAKGTVTVVIVGWTLLVLGSGVFTILLFQLSLVFLLATAAYAIIAWVRKRRIRRVPLFVAGWMSASAILVAIMTGYGADLHDFYGAAKREIIEANEARYELEITALSELGLETVYYFPRQYWWVKARDRILDDAGLTTAIPHLVKMAPQVIELDGTCVTSKGVALLEQVPGLNTLFLKDTPVDEEVLRALARFPSLEYVDLKGTRVTRAAIRDAAGAAWDSRMRGPNELLLWHRIRASVSLPDPENGQESGRNPVGRNPVAESSETIPVLTS